MSTINKPSVAVSIGDINGVGIAIALLAHKEITSICDPVYCINESMLLQASLRLNLPIPSDFKVSAIKGEFDIEPGKVTSASGKFSYDSFIHAITMTETGQTDAVVTLPVHKEAWSKAGLKYVGHTDLLRHHFQQDAIMMLGCPEMYVGLYTEHMPLKDVSQSIEYNRLKTFLIAFQRETKAAKVGVLGLNPHAGDNGVLGDEENIISKAISDANETIGKSVFHGPLVPDIAFTPHTRQAFTYYIAMYHDQGLGPLKALYFDESINVSLNLPIIRTSVDHGTAFDIAYAAKPKTKSYINAVKEAIRLVQNR